ncbi:MAG TPA: hypothetical protein VFH68_08720 [Polyangia bacterium]|jgi:hypothetical protein|nr:hypothetical protein [Polyangia bacterium]
MAEKVAKLGVAREKDFMYYVKDGAVWKVQRKQPGVPKGRPEKVADGGFQMDTNYIYFVDRDGDVARAKRAIGGQKRKKTAKAAKRRGVGKKPAAKKAAKSSAKKSAGKAKKSAGAKKKAGKKKGRR